MTTKADAHFVDCDFQQLTPVVWQSLRARTATSFRDVAHAMGSAEVTVTDTVPEVAWSPGTGVTDEAALAVDINPDGLIAATQNLDTGWDENDTSPVVLFDADGVNQNIDFDFSVASGDTIQAVSINVPDVRWSFDGTKIFVMTLSSAGARIHKYNPDGTRDWRVEFSDNTSGGSAFCIDSDDNMYLPFGGGDNDGNPIKVSPVDGTKRTTYEYEGSDIDYYHKIEYGANARVNDSCFSSTLNKVYFTGESDGTVDPDNVLVAGLDVTTGDMVYYTGGAANEGGSYICTNHEDVFVTGENGIFNTHSVIKLDGTTLSFLAGSGLLSYPVKGIWIGPDGTVFVSQSNGDPVNGGDSMVELNPATMAETASSPYLNIGNFCGGTDLGNSRRPAIGTLGVSDVDVSSVSQTRTVAYPQDYAHIEGQTVQVLADGIYLDDDTYTISSGAVDPAYTATTDHVGLQVVSKLQPMKIDGEVHVKKIRQIIPDVFESVGGEYGKALDDMYTMELRSTDDIMERDNALYSGYVELPYKGQYDRSGDIWVTQDIPLPMTVLGIGVRLSKEDI